MMLDALRFASMDNGKTRLWGRIEEVMRELGWSEDDLRREIGLVPQDTYNWKNRNDTIGAEQAFTIQEKTKFNAQWLMFGKGAKRVVELTAEEQRIVDAIRVDASKRTAIVVLLGLT
jgi:hypothetical protein